MSNTVSANNLDRVAWIVGRPAAEALDAEGLIRHDAWSAPKPTHYVLKVRAGKGPYTQQRGWMRNEIEDVLRTVIGSPYVWRYGSKGKNSTTSLDLEYKRKGPAETQAKKARACGLDAEVVPCILLPVNHVG